MARGFNVLDLMTLVNPVIAQHKISSYTQTQEIAPGNEIGVGLQGQPVRSDISQRDSEF